jgi:hypothetical protein
MRSVESFAADAEPTDTNNALMAAAQPTSRVAHRERLTLEYVILFLPLSTAVVG